MTTTTSTGSQPRSTLPEAAMPPATAYRLIADQLRLAHAARRFCNKGNRVDPWAARLHTDTVNGSLADGDAFPAVAAIEWRCCQIVADLWHADPDEAIGTSTVGSSEACMLAGLALKRRWQQARWAIPAGRGQPNLVLSSAADVHWEKFCSYWDVECRYVPVSLDHPVLDGHDLNCYIDENTIGVVVTMGVAQTGRYEPVQWVAAALDHLHASTGLNVAIHVDGARGGLVAPFLQPNLCWDFRLARVVSISTGAQHLSIAHPGAGWVVWRSPEHLPSELVFYVGDPPAQQPTFTLTSSRPAAPVLQQYYAFLRLGRAGFTALHEASRDVARQLAADVATLPALQLCSDGTDLPVVAWQRRPGLAWSLYELRDRLAVRGWRLPTAPLPDDLTGINVQHVAVRTAPSHQLANRLLADLRAGIAALAAGEGTSRTPER